MSDPWILRLDEQWWLPEMDKTDLEYINFDSNEWIITWIENLTPFHAWIYLIPEIRENDTSYLTLQNLSENYGLLFIGITSNEYSLDQNKFIGQSKNEWGFWFGGFKYHKGDYKNYSRAIKADEEIKLIMDWKRGALWLEINDEYQGIMFEGEFLIKGTFHFIVSMHQPESWIKLL